MLEIKGLTKKFKQRTVLRDINLSLKFGNIYGFIGANGSGKSVFSRPYVVF